MFEFLRRSPKIAASAAPEARATVLENGSVSISDRTGMLQILGMGNLSAGEPVTIDTALGVPAVFAAVNFLSRSLASLPLHVYKRSGKTVKKVESGLSRLLNEAWNAETSSFDARKYGWDQVFTGGRQFTFIERNDLGQPIALWPLNPEGVTVHRKDGLKSYEYRDGTRKVTYAASEVIDLAFMLKADGLGHRGPIASNAEMIGMAIAATKFGGAFFRGGGVPPFVVTGNFKSGKAMQAAADDLEGAVQKAAKDKRQALVLPNGLEIKQIGTDAEKAQLVETQKFLVEQIARVWALPPVFLQVLAGLTYSNSEQQDLHLVKHTLHAWVRQAEDEMNLKLFGAANNAIWVRHNVDGLLRGDFRTRMEGYAKGIQSGVMTPNEARDLEARETKDGGDQLFMQGAMLPLDKVGTAPGATDGNGGADGQKGQGNDN